MYYSYVEIEYVAMSFSPARTDLALKLLRRVMVVIPKRKLWDLESDLQGKDPKHTIKSWSVVWQYQDYRNLVLGQYQDYIFLSILTPR